MHLGVSPLLSRWEFPPGKTAFSIQHMMIFGNWGKTMEIVTFFWVNHGQPHGRSSPIHHRVVEHVTGSASLPRRWISCDQKGSRNQ